METARQILRWSIPGFVFMLNILAFQSIWRLLNNPKNGLSEFLDSATTHTLIAAFAASLPIGFILYQMYYFRYKSSASILGTTLFYRRDRGAHVLGQYLTAYKGSPESLARYSRTASSEELSRRLSKAPFIYPRRIPLLHIKPGSRLCDPELEHKAKFCAARCTNCRSAYNRTFIDNWTLLQTVLGSLECKPGLAPIKKEYTNGSDLYHTLGASRYAVGAASIGIFTFNACILLGPAGSPGLAESASALLILGVFTFWQYYVMYKCRQNVERDYARRLASMFSIVLTGPAFDNQSIPAGPPAHAFDYPVESSIEPQADPSASTSPFADVDPAATKATTG
ncbi:hypothetical protein [Gordonia sp. SL306]|uniref:hypothetical protein n=1 Tax=Gordonia sp. SL306 TaxID=2995145 RepID=UPI00226F6A41|nr:hypothetical protein [Gordonia sp. SL306]WAC57578.1 hypothetical protein OVA31_10260 [Gordonia sp. SL306]